MQVGWSHQAVQDLKWHWPCRVHATEKRKGRWAWARFICPGSTAGRLVLPAWSLRQTRPLSQWGSASPLAEAEPVPGTPVAAGNFAVSHCSGFRAWLGGKSAQLGFPPCFWLFAPRPISIRFSQKFALLLQPAGERNLYFIVVQKNDWGQQGAESVPHSPPRFWGGNWKCTGVYLEQTFLYAVFKITWVIICISFEAGIYNSELWEV